MVNFDVIRFSQNGKELFMGSLTGRELSRLDVRVDAWGAWIGYQRAKMKKKARKIADFLETNRGLLPTSVLISVRSPRTRFRPIRGSYGRLTVPNSARIFVVDGQHRADGLKIAMQRNPSLSNFAFPVVFICPRLWAGGYNSEMEEGKQFISINKTQTKVPPDLVDSILWTLNWFDQQGSPTARESLPTSIYEEMNIRASALSVVYLLKDYQNWRNLIKLTNTNHGGTTVNQSVMVDTLVKEILQKVPYNSMSIQSLALRLDDYWEAIRRFYPAARGNPAQYFVQRRLGVSVFHRIFSKVDMVTPVPKGADQFSNSLQGFHMKDEEYWGPRGTAAKRGTSYKAVRLIAGQISRRKRTSRP